jgi:hypothetical protein
MPTSTATAKNLSEIADKIVKALDRNTAAQLTVAAMIGKQTGDITAVQLPDFIKNGVIQAFYALLGQSET